MGRSRVGEPPRDERLQEIETVAPTLRLAQTFSQLTRPRQNIAQLNCPVRELRHRQAEQPAGAERGQAQLDARPRPGAAHETRRRGEAGHEGVHAEP